MSLKSLRSKSAAVPTAPVIQPRAYSIAEAAKYIGATVWFLRTLVWNRRIPFLKHGHRYAFDRVDLDRFLESNKIGVAR
jgi:excisionase family DNA binding protein